MPPGLRGEADSFCVGAMEESLRVEMKPEFAEEQKSGECSLGLIGWKLPSGTWEDLGVMGMERRLWKVSLQGKVAVEHV